MNKIRQQSIKNITDKISSLIEELKSVCEDENKYLENVPENLQTSDRYERSEIACDVLSDAISDIQSSIEALNEIT